MPWVLGGGDWMDGVTDPSPHRPAASPPEPPEPIEAVHVPMIRIVAWGTLAWLVVLAATLLMAPLHDGPRSWWPWCATAGAGLGLLGWVYLRRGRGNAAES